MTTARMSSGPRSPLVALAALILIGCAAGPSASPQSSNAARTPTPKPQLPSPAASAGPVTTPATSTSGWQRLGTLGESLGLDGMAASPAGYVVLQGRRTVWFSADGASWTPTVLPFESKGTFDDQPLGASAITIAGGPDGFVAAGSYAYPPCDPEGRDGGPPACGVAPISWASTDGVTWKSSIKTVLPLDGKKLPAYSVFAHVWPAGDGWDAAVEVRAGMVNHGNMLLHSLDGVTWSRSKAAPLPDGISSRDIFAHGGVASGDGRRVHWQAQDESHQKTTLATSADGLAWTVVSGFDGKDVMIDAALGPDETGDGTWLLLGGDALGGRWWASNDLHSWRSGAMPITGFGAASVARSSGGYVAVGDRQPRVWSLTTAVSTDGTTWSTLEQLAELDSPVYVVAGPAGVIGVGRDFRSDGPGGAAWLWVDPGP